MTESATAIVHEAHAISRIGNVLETEELVTKLTARRASAHLVIVCHDDYLAAHVHAILCRSGISVPADVSIIAPDDRRNR